jgi:ribosome-binding factor A
MPSTLRLQRIADRIQQELSELILLKASDPRLGGVTVTGVKVDRELAFADVFVSAVEGVQRSTEIIQALRHAAGFLRHELSARVELRAMPRLRFHWDPTPENADHIERLLATLHQEEDQNRDEGEPMDEDVDDR